MWCFWKKRFLLLIDIPAHKYAQEEYSDPGDQTHLIARIPVVVRVRLDPEDRYPSALDLIVIIWQCLQKKDEQQNDGKEDHVAAAAVSAACFFLFEMIEDSKQECRYRKDMKHIKVDLAVEVETAVCRDRHSGKSNSHNQEFQSALEVVS